MRWTLRTGAQQLVLSTDRAAPFAGAVMLSDTNQAAALLRDLSYDAANMKALRQIHDELVGSHNARSRADTLILAEVMGRVAAGRLYVFEPGHRIVANYDPIEEPDEDWEDAEALAPTPPPAEAPEPAPSPAVLAQVAALQHAAQSGAPFCDE